MGKRGDKWDDQGEVTRGKITQSLKPYLPCSLRRSQGLPHCIYSINTCWTGETHHASTYRISGPDRSSVWPQCPLVTTNSSPRPSMVGFIIFRKSRFSLGLGAQPVGPAVISGICLTNYSLQLGLNQLQKIPEMRATVRCTPGLHSLPKQQFPKRMHGCLISQGSAGGLDRWQVLEHISVSLSQCDSKKAP